VARLRPCRGVARGAMCRTQHVARAGAPWARAGAARAHASGPAADPGTQATRHSITWVLEYSNCKYRLYPSKYIYASRSARLSPRGNSTELTSHRPICPDTSQIFAPSGLQLQHAERTAPLCSSSVGTHWLTLSSGGACTTCLSESVYTAGGPYSAYRPISIEYSDLSIYQIEH
jgi:hypothetical protein